MKALTYFLFVLLWISGVVVAKGFFSTLFALIIPFWSFYLIIEYAIFGAIL